MIDVQIYNAHTTWEERRLLEPYFDGVPGEMMRMGFCGEVIMGEFLERDVDGRLVLDGDEILTHWRPLNPSQMPPPELFAIIARHGVEP